MTEHELTGELDLLGDWLDAKGYGEEAGLVLYAMGFIHQQANRIVELRKEADMMHSEYKTAAARVVKLKSALERMLLEFDFMVERGVIPDIRNDIIFVEARAALEGKND